MITHTRLWIKSLGGYSILADERADLDKLRAQYERIIDEKYKPYFEKTINNYAVSKNQYSQYAVAYNARTELVLNSYSDEKDILKFLGHEINLSWYFSLLGKLSEKYLVAVAVRDTPGSKITKDELDCIHGYGFKSFQSRYGIMYIGIKFNGNIVFDKYGDAYPDPVIYDEHKLNADLSLKISSMAWKNGNKAEIIINGTDYAVNIRGINIVVYDTENNKLIDSVAFDYHTENRVCKHKN